MPIPKKRAERFEVIDKILGANAPYVEGVHSGEWLAMYVAKHPEARPFVNYWIANNAPGPIKYVYYNCRF